MRGKLSLDISDLIGHYLYCGFWDRPQNRLMHLANKRDNISNNGSNIGVEAFQFVKKKWVLK